MVCGASGEGGAIAPACPAAMVFSSVDFASFGTPTGTCGSYALGGCNSGTTLGYVQSMCLGLATCNTIYVNTAVFGDPCGGVHKARWWRSNQ